MKKSGQNLKTGPFYRLAFVGIAALTVANCSSSQKITGGVDPKYGVSASPRVVADGKPVPKGGGREMVGKPYTIAGKVYVPRADPNYSRTGTASWYGSQFHGRLTANGEIFDKYTLAAAHPTMPLPSYARVTNLSNDRSIVVRVNDRGPYHSNRVVDVSQRAAEMLDFKRQGTAKVKVDYLGRASVKGSDDNMLMASLRLDGTPASVASLSASSPVSVVSNEPALRQEAKREPLDVQGDRVQTASSLSPQALAYADPASENPEELTTASPAPNTYLPEPIKITALEDAINHTTAAPLPPRRPADLELGAPKTLPPVKNLSSLSLENQGKVASLAKPM